MSPSPQDEQRETNSTKLTATQAEAQLTLLHYALFEQLPDEGRMHGWTPMVATSAFMRDRLNSQLPTGAPRLSSGQVAAELRNLATVGLAVKVMKPLSSDTLGWQRTKRAAELLAAYHDAQEAHHDAV